MTPEEAVTAVDRLGAAFGRADLEDVVGQLVPDSAVLYSGSEQGEVVAGLPALRALLTDLFARHERYSWRCDGVEVTSHADGAALVAEATLEVRPVGDPPAEVESVPYRVAGSLERHGDRWCWRAVHGSEPVTPAGPAPRR